MFDRTGHHRRSGTAIVEFAFVVPIIFTLVLGLLEWGRFETLRQASSTAAFNAARLGTIPGATSTDMQQRAEEVLDTYLVQGAIVSSAVTPDSVTVTVQIPMNQNLWFLSQFFGNVTIEREFTLQI